MRVDPSIVRRTAVILGTIAIPWVGCSLWSARRERAEKQALAAEIHAEMASRPPWPDRTARRRDLTAEYDAILAGLGNDRACGELTRLLQDKAPWTGLPKQVRSDLAEHAAALAALDALAAEAEPGWMRCVGGSSWKQWMHLRLLLSARGRACMANGDWDGFLRNLRALRRAADDSLAAFVLPGPPNPAGNAGGLEDEALAQMALAAVHPALPEQAATDLLALAGEPWNRVAVFDGLREWRRDWADRFCLDMLGDDAEAAMKSAGLLADSSFSDRIAARLPRRDGRQTPELPTAAPPAETVRRMRAIADRYYQAEACRDTVAIGLGGELDLEVRRDLGGRWTAGNAFAIPSLSRFRWRMEARLPVLRAAFAIRIHEARTGRVAPNLEHLVPSILDAVPADAWTGKPVVYAPGPGAGWLLEAGPPAASFEHEPGARETTEPWQLRKH